MTTEPWMLLAMGIAILLLGIMWLISKAVERNRAAGVIVLAMALVAVVLAVHTIADAAVLLNR